ncbi:PilC/PilY family type IV pilus protein [Accumulibacter sp.]|uniref:PilC/PilY family type IV pilus protein n=1 Tax=Accumulibacter sp. TaxID=2053492 RepID=UPI002C794423|nr:PilC/PilY family type IV pilus protein [Accumulibacter sp.]HNC25512.1 PilC/PilY family type IV pilus protein [Accumulibacter sp.]
MHALCPPITRAYSLLAAALVLAAGVQAATTDLATAPLSGASEIQVYPNIMFVLDDSYSMNDEALPDWANVIPLHLVRNPGFNGITYNPATRYVPPAYYSTTGAPDTTTYPSRTRAATSGWTNVTDDGYGVQRRGDTGTTGNSNLTHGAYYYTTVVGEYCTDRTLRNCVAANAPSTSHPVPAALRWCNSLAASLAATPPENSCRALYTDNGYKYPRMPEPHTSKLTISVGGSVANISVNNQKILPAAIPSSGAEALATSIVAGINACSFGIQGNCQTVGYRASASGNVVTISAPAAFTTPTQPSVEGDGTFQVTAFGRSTTEGENQAPGDVVLNVITEARTTYPKAATRLDCGTSTDTTCTYDEEMTNYANWWAYYRTRMQTMKTATSLAFASVGEQRRVGYMTINNNTGRDFRNIQEFSPANKNAWYNKLFSAVPVSGADTPLRQALSNAGHIYAGLKNGQQFNGETVVDPMQYYCQKNFTILSTDGYWNQQAGFTLTGGAVGDQDGAVARPQYDGGAGQALRVVSKTLQTRTPTRATQTQMRSEQLQSKTWQLQEQTTVPQSTTRNLETRTSALIQIRYQLWESANHLQQRTNTLPTISTRDRPQSSIEQLQKRTLSSWQGKTARLQLRQSYLQTKTSALQKQTATLRTLTYTLQVQTSPLMQTLRQVQARTSSNGGESWSQWQDVDRCEEDTRGSSLRECRMLPTVTREVSECRVSAAVENQTINQGTDSETRLWVTGSSCTYGSASGFQTATTTCVARAPSIDSGEGSVFQGPATECRYAAGDWTDATGACTRVERSSGSPYNVLTARECDYVSSGWSDATAACSPQARSTSSPYTVLSATECRYGDFGEWTYATGACTPRPQDLSAYTIVQATQCRYTGFSDWWDASSACTATAEDPSNYTVVTARECRYSSYSDWANTASPPCVVQAPSNSSPYTVLTATSECRQTWTDWADTNQTCVAAAGATECRYAPPTAAVDDATCPGSASAKSTGPTYSVTQAKTCSYAWTAPTVTGGTCTPNADTVCGTTWTDWSDTDSCTVQAGIRECRYNPATTSRAVDSCTTAAASNGSPYTVPIARVCSYQFLDFANNITACTSLAQSTSSPYTVGLAVQCNYLTDFSPDFWSAWTTANAGCTVTSRNGDDYVGPGRECRYAGETQPADDPGCPESAVAPSTGPNYTVPVAKTCSTRWGSWHDATTCTDDGSTRRCSYVEGEWANAAECTPVARQNGPAYSTNGRECRTIVGQDWHDVASCTPGTSNGETINCTTVVPQVTRQYVAGCPSTGSPTCSQPVDEPASDANGGVATTYQTTRTSPADVDSCTPSEPQNCPADESQPDLCERIECSARSLGPTPNTLADVAQYYYMTDLRTPTLGNCYSNGDTTRNVCQGPDGSGADAEIQRMNTYTLGLGASGLMQYDSRYQEAREGDGSDFASIKWTTMADPAMGICSWQTAGECNWPKPYESLAQPSQNSRQQANIDDLWHAAVNGRGTYFSARDPTGLANAIGAALADIGSARGSVAAVTLTSPNLVAGDGNGVFQSSFEVGVWAGDVIRRSVDGATGVVSSSITWSAEERLRRKLTNEGAAAADHRRRTIYTFNPSGESATGAGDRLKPFVWSSLSDSEKAYLQSPWVNAERLSQTACVSESDVVCLDPDVRANAGGETLLNFLRGDATNEGTVDNRIALYRKRTASGSDVHRPLGDIAGSEPVYVQAPPWNYVDQQYAQFRESKSNRQAMIYVGANDGMLHAFYAADGGTGIIGGDEAWAYVPRLAFPRLAHLADKRYPTRHQYTVDGTPVMGDICADTPANCRAASTPELWKTILVGGLNNGGRGYYALDITDPGHPKALWEFTHDNLGYSFGNPVITKLRDGTWVVLFASGYNNITPGDGQGRLFIVNANSGQLVAAINGGSISTGVGSVDAPSGLAKISAWANFPDLNNTAERIYGGDLAGNLWRFDVNGEIPQTADPPVYDAQRLATLKDAAGNPQPITTRPELGRIAYQPVVFVGTGKLLGASDFLPIHESAPRFQQQSFYAIKDRLTDTDFGDPRTTTVAQPTGTGTGTTQVSNFTRWVLTAGTCSTVNPVCRAGDPIVQTAALPRESGETDEAYAVRQQQTRQAMLRQAFGPYNDGWYLDLPGDGEQANTDPGLTRGILVFNTNRPLEGGGCVPVAVSYQYWLDYRTGGALETTMGLVARKLGDTLATSAKLGQTSGGEQSGGEQPVFETGFDNRTVGTDSPPAGTPPPVPRRVSWRELTNE